jgi:hypothetical protein
MTTILQFALPTNRTVILSTAFQREGPFSFAREKLGAKAPGGTTLRRGKTKYGGPSP